ncbi:ATP-binding protein [Streptomyces sp. NPDC001635]
METSEARNITSNNKQQLEMNNETLEKMKQLRLFGMYDAFKTNLESSVKESLTTDQFISVLVASEWDDRRNRSVERTIRAAAFRYKASLEHIDYSIERGLDRNQVHRLAALDFIKEHKDIFITGSTGTGKSYLATALGYQACQAIFNTAVREPDQLMLFTCSIVLVLFKVLISPRRKSACKPSAGKICFLMKAP